MENTTSNILPVKHFAARELISLTVEADLNIEKVTTLFIDFLESEKSGGNSFYFDLSHLFFNIQKNNNIDMGILLGLISPDIYSFLLHEVFRKDNSDYKDIRKFFLDIHFTIQRIELLNGQIKPSHKQNKSIL